MKEKGTISIHTENIFPIIKKFLYSDHEIFLRELVSNAVDATQKIKRLSSLGEYQEELGDLTVEVLVDKSKKTITVRDKGIGMTAEEIKKYINQIAFSGAAEFVEKFKDSGDAKEIIGKFGLGFYSAFMVAGKVEIVTKSYLNDSKAARWECDGDTEFSIAPAKKSQRGTDVTLHINEDSTEFLEDTRIQGILNKYAKFLPVTVKFGEKDKSVEDGKDKDGNPKYKTIKVDNIINETEPIWTKTPADLEDQDYLDFYQSLYPFAEEPQFWIHLNVDYPFNLTGVLYFPRLKNDFEVQKNKIQLYSRQVFITDEVKDIVPEFLMLLHGVIDSPDIPLNVSRSFLQSDSNVKKINSYITKKVADKLGELYKKDRTAYEEKWANVGLFVKYGMLTDEKFYDKAKEFALVKNTEGKYFNLDEYREKVAVNQKDKDDNIIFLYTTDASKQHTFIQSAQKRAYDVLEMNEVIDSHWINLLEQKLDKTQLKRVDADTLDKLIDTGDAKESVLSEEQQDQLKEVFTKAVENDQVMITVESMATDEMPVSITLPEFMRRMKDMAATGGGGMPFMGQMPNTYNVAVNANHPMSSKILSAKREDTRIKYAKQAYDLALLSQNMLDGASLTRFIERSVELASK